MHSSYGEELGFNSDEEGYGRDAIDDVPPLPPDTDPVIITLYVFYYKSLYSKEKVSKENIKSR